VSDGNTVEEDRLEFLKPDTFALFIAVVVPGVVAAKVYALLVPSDARNWSDDLIEIATYGFITYGLFFWAYHLVTTGSFPRDHPVVATLFTLLLVTVPPALLALLAFKVRQSWWVGIATWLHVPVTEQEPTAWDYFFSEKRPVMVLAYLRSGDVVGGLYRAKSNASAYPHPQQIYLEEIWELDEPTSAFLHPIADTAGCILNHDDIEKLYFFTQPVTEGAVGKETTR